MPWLMGEEPPQPTLTMPCLHQHHQPCFKMDRETAGPSTRGWFTRARGPLPRRALNVFVQTDKEILTNNNPRSKIMIEFFPLFCLIFLPKQEKSVLKSSRKSNKTSSKDGSDIEK